MPYVLKPIEVRDKLVLPFVALLLAGCTTGEPVQEEGSVVLDVSLTYPEKIIPLSEIADVSYVQLSEVKDDYLFSGFPLCVTEQTIVVYDPSSGDVLFFSRDGQPKSKFNRQGNGPGEYIYIRAKTACYDEAKDEFFVFVDKRVDVISATGRYKRSLPLPEGLEVSEMVLWGDDALLLYDNSLQMKQVTNMFDKIEGGEGKESKTVNSESPEPIFCISIQDGSIQDYIALPHDHEIDMSQPVVINGEPVGVMTGRMNHIVYTSDGVLLRSADTDVLYLYGNDRSLTPVMVQTPSMADLQPIVYLNSMVQAGTYQFMELLTGVIVDNRRFQSTYLVRDTRDGKVSTQKIVFDDYTKKEVAITPLILLRTQNGNEGMIEIPLAELRRAYTNGELSGELETLMASMDEDNENDVYVLLRFK